MSENNTIALIIPVFNRLDYTKECFHILDEQKGTEFFQKNVIHIILADDGSSDGTESWVKKHYPEVIILRGDGNLWWSGTMNLGVKHALDELQCDFILLWENDIIPVDDYFNNLQSVIEGLEPGIMVCSKVFYRVQPNRIFAMGGRFDSRSGKKSLIGRGVIDNKKYSKILEVDWSLGQGVLIHKSIFKAVGYFDEKRFPQYSGDADFSLRVKEAGYRNLVYPNLKLLNDTETTGISHNSNMSLKEFLQSLHSIRSNSSIVKDMKFYRVHATSVLAYKALIKKYFIYTGSFVKWKVLSWFGVNRKNQEIF